MRKNKGFTLVELVVTVAIVGLLITLSMPKIKEWLHGYRLKGAARDLYGNLQLAKMTAVKENQDCTVTFNTGTDQYSVSCLDNKTVTLTGYGSGVHFIADADAAPFSHTHATTLTFNPRGLSQSRYGYLTNDKQTGYYKVGALSSGVIKSQRWYGGAWK